ncbi:DUF4158 domain-containing protein [Aliiroseovarius halocynthiae]|uniref:DUF4158 domain-containing protein n=1 Tax=Aliiroseovarius halocynthiae TaxID=985055 RepID=A0A545SW55_9RHOB|nr:DUF4158 domain-containing protein [Aliiroseovarius halocynthiae]
MFKGKAAKKMLKWLDQHAEAAASSESLVRGFVEECRRRQIILPGMTVSNVTVLMRWSLLNNGSRHGLHRASAAKCVHG